MIETDILILEVMTAGITAAITAIATFFIGVKRATKRIAEQYIDLKKDNELIKRCLIISAKLSDSQTKHSHPDTDTTLESITKDMLTRID